MLCCQQDRRVDNQLELELELDKPRIVKSVETRDKRDVGLVIALQSMSTRRAQTELYVQTHSQTVQTGPGQHRYSYQELFIEKANVCQALNCKNIDQCWTVEGREDTSGPT